LADGWKRRSPMAQLDQRLWLIRGCLQTDLRAIGCECSRHEADYGFVCPKRW